MKRILLVLVLTINTFSVEILPSETAELIKLILENNGKRYQEVELDIKGSKSMVINLRREILRKSTPLNYKVYEVSSSYIEKDGLYVEYPKSVPIVREAIVFSNDVPNLKRITFSFRLDDGNLEILGNIVDMSKKGIKMDPSVLSFIKLRKP